MPTLFLIPAARETCRRGGSLEADKPKRTRWLSGATKNCSTRGDLRTATTTPDHFVSIRPTIPVRLHRYRPVTGLRLLRSANRGKRRTMIEAFTLATAHHFGDALASQARLRYKTFVAHRGLPHQHYAGLEYDEFDTPAAVYFVWRDDAGDVRGLARLLPTIRPYMLQAYWPEMVETEPLPASPDIWEVTRVCVDRALRPAQRLRVFPEVFAAVDEFCARQGIAAIVGVTRPHLITHHYRSGYRWLGQPALVEGEIERAFTLPCGQIRSRAACERLAIPASVLRTSVAERWAQAA